MKAETGNKTPPPAPKKKRIPRRTVFKPIPVCRVRNFVKQQAPQFKADRVIVITQSDEDEMYSITTYGRNKEYCDSAKLVGDQIHRMVQSRLLDLQE